MPFFVVEFERRHVVLVLQFLENPKNRMILHGTIAWRAGRSEEGRGPSLVGARSDAVPDQLISRITDDDDFRAGNEYLRRDFLRHFILVVFCRCTINGERFGRRVSLHGNLDRGVVSFPEEDPRVFHAIRPRTYAGNAIGDEADPAAVGGTSQFEFRRLQTATSVKFVAAMAKESDDIVVMIRSFGEIVDRILLGTSEVNGSPVRRFVGIREGDVAVFYSIRVRRTSSSFKTFR